MDIRSSIKSLSGRTRADKVLFRWAVSVETTEAPLPNCTSVGELGRQSRFSLDAVLWRRKLASAPVSNLAAASGFGSESPTSHFCFLLFFSSCRIALNAF
jgi:hypothetical protein